MEKVLGVFLPAFIAVVIKRLKIEDHNEKVLVSVVACAGAAFGMLVGLQKPFNLEEFGTLVAVYLGLSQTLYQVSKGLKKQ